MDIEERWTRFVDGVTVVWIGLFALTLASDYGLLAVPAGTASAVEAVLRSLFLLFVLDVLLLYRWSEEAPLAFTRSNWLRIATAIPWLRPFRLLRVGRGVRALRVLVGSRRVGAFLNKLRRIRRRGR